MMNPSKSRNILRKKIKAVKNEVDRLNGIMIGIQQNLQWHFENQLPHPNHLDDEYNECRVNEVKLLKHLKLYKKNMNLYVQLQFQLSILNYHNPKECLV